MGKYVAENTVKKLIRADKQIKGSKVVILSITFKEDCPDVRNTKVIDIISELKDYGIDITVVDSLADAEEVYDEYGLELHLIDDIKDMHAVIIAVPHKEFEKLTLEEIKKYYWNHKPVLIDVKGMMDIKKAEEMNYLYWRL